ncbi:MAG: hypothetical protein EZS28_054444 [Streblomastix strix]|uniref:Uncharacterized protein n=1 Tax=Streblomastix strix TaxID=222440 RepID=A0A5J4QKH5_9EUKA|nr:MAG: hypothetical protein EZS28_054444 [Streblomastix strix]
MMLAQVIARSDTTNKDWIGITNLLFGIQQLEKARIGIKIFRPLIPSAILKQKMRPMLNSNENHAFEQIQEARIIRTRNDMPPQNSGPGGQPPPEQEPTGPYMVIPQSTIFLSALNTGQEIQEIPN